jgi:hypothetical protein
MFFSGRMSRSFTSEPSRGLGARITDFGLNLF